MNSNFINGDLLNGAANPSWVIRAVAAATAIASFAVAPTRVTFAAAYGNAAVSVSLTQTNSVKAQAVGVANSTASVAPTLTYEGKSAATATSTGSGSVLRNVFSSAGGDATCYGEALLAEAIGDATATSTLNVVLANAHIVFPGRALTPCVATGTGSGDVKRYSNVFSNYGVSIHHGEASVKRRGTSFYEHDGYVRNATAGATSDVLQDRIKIIATLGSFDYCDSTATARSFVKHFGIAHGFGITTAPVVAATHVYLQRLNAQATAVSTATGIRNVLPTVNANSRSTAYSPKALINHAASSTVSAQASISAAGFRVTFAKSTTTATATTPNAIEYGVHHRATVSGSAIASSSASAKQRHAGMARNTANALVLRAAGSSIQFCLVHTTMATALVGRAYGLANSEIKAPAARYMIVPAEDRVMFVPAEDRIMVVTT